MNMSVKKMTTPLRYYFLKLQNYNFYSLLYKPNHPAAAAPAVKALPNDIYSNFDAV